MSNETPSDKTTNILDSLFSDADMVKYLRDQVDQLNRRIDELDTQLRDTVQNNLQWIPCSVQYPKRNEFVLTFGAYGKEVRCWDTVDDTDEYDGHAINYEMWFKEEEYDNDPYFSIEFDEVTHWCPLPADPKKCKREDNNV
jgi:hypothetical protein